jgi:hypothetical protein
MRIRVRDRIALPFTGRSRQFRLTQIDGTHSTLKQTDFGITPVTVAGGTVKVKDEVKIEFEIALMK